MSVWVSESGRQGGGNEGLSSKMRKDGGMKGADGELLYHSMPFKCAIPGKDDGSDSSVVSMNHAITATHMCTPRKP